MKDIQWNKKCIYCGGRVFTRTHWNETLWERNAQISLEGFKCYTCGKNILKEEMVELNAPLKVLSQPKHKECFHDRQDWDNYGVQPKLEKIGEHEWKPVCQICKNPLHRRGKPQKEWCKCGTKYGKMICPPDSITWIQCPTCKREIKPTEIKPPEIPIVEPLEEGSVEFSTLADKINEILTALEAKNIIRRK